MADPTPLETSNDIDLLRDAQRSSAAFRVLYDRHGERIHAFHLRRTRDPGAAFELTAETFAQAWLSRGRFAEREAGLVAPWLFGIARHVLASSVRRRSLERRARERLHLALGPATEMATVDPSWLTDLDDDMRAALAELPDGQRRAIELRVLADEAYDDIARRLGASPAAIRVRVHRGLATIRRRLAEASDT